MTFLDEARRITQQALPNEPWFRVGERDLGRMNVADARFIAVFNPATINTLLDAVEKLDSLTDFLDNVKQTSEPPRELLDLGYAAVETSADYEREEELTLAALAALAAVRDALPAKEPESVAQKASAPATAFGAEEQA